MKITKTNDEWTVEGTAWRVGNNVNTESITPSRWLHEGEAPMLEHIGEILIPEFPKKMNKGDFWVGGSNLGCSSSRNAPLFLKKKGIGVVLCHSASRIFYRNALNSGLPIFEIGDEVAKIRMGDRLKGERHDRTHRKPDHRSNDPGKAPARLHHANPECGRNYRLHPKQEERVPVTPVDLTFGRPVGKTSSL